VDISVTVFVCLFLWVCAVTDFSVEDKGSGVEFCMVVHRRPGQGISHFRELCSSRSSPEAQNGSPALCSHDAGVRTGHAQDCHVWIYDRPRRRTYLFKCLSKLIELLICRQKLSILNKQFTCVDNTMKKLSTVQHCARHWTQRVSRTSL